MKLRWMAAGALTAGAVYFALFGGDYSLLEVRRLRRELAEERTRLEVVREENTRLRARVDSLQDDSATLERVARERWGLIRPGERLYRFADSAAAPVHDTIPAGTHPPRP